MRLRLPREHGSWGMFFIPFVLGWIVAWRTNVPLVLLLVASAVVFLSRESLLFWWRMRRRKLDSDGSGPALLLYGGVAAGAGIPLLLVYGLYWLAGAAMLGAAALFATAELEVRRQGRAVATEFLAVATSAMNAATAHYAGTGELTRTAFALWALSAAYFGSSIFYVKLRVRNAHGKSPDEIRRARRNCAAYHLLLFFGLVAAWFTGLPSFAAVGFIPVLIRACVHLTFPTRELNLKRVGWQEVVFSVLFLFVVGAAFA